MAWVLQFDGVNDYTSLASPVFNPIPIGGSLEYNGIRGFGTPSLQMFINVYQGARTDIIAFNNLGIIRVRIDGTIKNSVDSVAQGDQFTLLITRTASLYAISLNGVHQFDIVETADMSELLGFCQSNFRYEGDLLTSTLNNGTSDTALWDATASSHAAGTPVLTDTIGGNDATGVNMPTDGSAWVDLGGSGISIVGDTALFDFNALAGTVELTGEILVTGSTASFDYTSINGSVDLTGQLIVTGDAANFDYTALPGGIDLTGEIIVTGSTANFNYTGENGAIELGAAINVVGQTANFDVNGVNAEVSLTGEINIIGDTATFNYQALSSLVVIGEGQKIGTVTAGFADSTIGVQYKQSTITVNFGE